jgi:hypothetical protein
MTEYYRDEDLDRFGEIGKYHPDLFRKFMNWYTSALEPMNSGVTPQFSSFSVLF